MQFSDKISQSQINKGSLIEDNSTTDRIFDEENQM